MGMLFNREIRKQIPQFLASQTPLSTSSVVQNETLRSLPREYTSGRANQIGGLPSKRKIRNVSIYYSPASP
jgi:hypothetical protein